MEHCGRVISVRWERNWRHRKENSFREFSSKERNEVKDVSRVEKDCVLCVCVFHFNGRQTQHICRLLCVIQMREESWGELQKRHLGISKKGHNLCGKRRNGLRGSHQCPLCSDRRVGTWLWICPCVWWPLTNWFTSSICFFSVNWARLGNWETLSTAPSKW